MKGQLFRLALLGSSALGLGMATPVYAQDTPAPDAVAEDEDAIIVTARRREEALQDVPISITVFNQEQLSDRNVTNAQDLAIFTPSLSATTAFGPNNSTFAIRGFVQEIGTSPSVGVYFADVVAPRGASQGFPAGDGAGPGMFFDLQNVQVLKGPQGTLFGRNTTGGAVLLVPNKPTDRFEGWVEGSLGNYDLRRIQAVFNAPISPHVRVRLGADWHKRDGFLISDTGIGPRDFDDVNYIALRGSLVLDVTPELENYTIASFTDSDTNGHPQKIIHANASVFPLGTFAALQLARRTSDNFWHLENDMPDAYTKLRQWQVINTTTWQASDNLTVKNIISYAQLWTKTRADLFGTNFIIPLGFFAAPVPPFFPGFPAADTPIGFAVIRHLPEGYSSNQSTFTEEFQLQGNLGDGALEWQAGVYYEDAKPRGFIGSQSPVFIGCSDPDNFVCTDLLGAGAINFTAAKNTFKSRGVYAQATYAITEQFKVTGGFRYTWDKTRSLSRRITFTFPPGVPNASPNPIGAGPTVPNATSYCTDFNLGPNGLPVRSPPLCELDESASWSKPTWLINFDYKPNEDILVYAKYARGYRTGGIKSDVPIEFHVFDPEKVDSFEVGAKTNFEGAVRGHFNVAAFYNKFSNQQIQFGFNRNNNRRDPVTGAPLPPIAVTPTAGPVNVGKSTIWGIELDWRLRLFRGFTLDGGYTYLKTKVKEVVTPTLPTDSPYTPNGFIVVGDPLAFAPKHKLSVTATYILPLDESIGEVSIGATYTHTSKQISNYTNRLPNVIVLSGGVDLGLLASRDLVNLNVNWDSVAGSPVDLSFFVTNLFNEKYFTAVPGLLGSTGFEAATLGEPRMWGARARFRFGE